MIHALASGVLFRPPEQRTAKSGKTFVTATLKVKDGESLLWVRVTAFSESARAELMQLGEGDALSLQGRFKAELYRPDDGEPRVSLSIIADLVLACRQPPKKRASKAPEQAVGKWNGPSDGPNDEVPF